MIINAPAMLRGVGSCCECVMLCWKKLLGSILSFYFAGVIALEVSAQVAAEHFKFRAFQNSQLELIGGHWDAVEDSKGFIWFAGTAGLARFDGYQFRLYKHDPLDAKTLSNSLIKRLLVDVNGVLWVATARGLNRYNIDSDTFERYLHDPNDSNSLAHNDIVDLIQSRNGGLWLATSGGLNYFDTANNRFTHYKPNSGALGALQDSQVLSLHEDNDGTLWVGTRYAGLHQLKDGQTTFTHFAHQPNNANSLSDMQVLAIKRDREGDLWVATFNGLNRWLPGTQKFERFMHDPEDSSSLGGKVVRDILEDSNGNLWLAIDGGGVNIFNRNNATFIRYSNEAKTAPELSNDQVRSVFEDSRGGIWFGHYPAGISKTDFYASSFQIYQHQPLNKNSLSHSDILSAKEDKAGNLWLGTEKGVNFIQRKTGEISSYQHDPNDPETLKMNPVKIAFVDSKDRIWTGTWRGGMSRFNRETGKFKHYPELEGNVVQDIIESRDGLLWVGSNKGLSAFNPETETFQYFAIEGSEHHPRPATEIYTLVEDREGILWMGRDDNLTRFDPNTQAFEYFEHDPNNPLSIAAGSVRAIYEDSQGSLWVGSGSDGVSILDKSTKTFTRITLKDGLANNKVGCFIEDHNGFMWVSTGQGISRVSPSRQQFRNYTTEHGIAGNLHKRPACARTANNELIFGSTKGLTLFHPDRLSENTLPPAVALTNFRLFNKHVPVTEAGLLQKTIMTAEELILKHSDSVFSFDFVALNYTMPERNEYAYMMEGFDKEWVYSGDRRTTTYTNLNPGKYVFRVKGSNNEGVWSEGDVSIPITILPPWWATWWAYTLYIALLVSIIANAFYRQHLKRKAVEEQNKLLEIKVAERSADLIAKNNDIQAMLSNMQQGLFTIQRGGTVHPEYSRYLSEIFETENIAGQNAFDLLFGHARIGVNTLSQLQESISVMLGNDQLNFEFNAHLLIAEYTADINGHMKHLSLDWSPIYEEGLLEKLMVSVRDITDLKKAEKDAQLQRRELDILSQLIAVPHKKLAHFFGSAAIFIQENQSLIASNSEGDNECLAALFRNMHTLKGNSRTYGLHLISDAAHSAESRYTDIRKQKAAWHSADLLQDLDVLQALLSEYTKVYHQVLKPNTGRNHRQDDCVCLELASVQEMNKSLERALAKMPESEELRFIQRTLSLAKSISVADALSDIIQSLTSIASQLQKETPQVVIEDDDIRLKPECESLLQDVFAHLLRNCIDHGIEPASERVKAGKPACGRIDVECRQVDENICMLVKDDGRGAYLPALYEQYCQQNPSPATQDPTVLDVLNTMFASGVSTKQEISDISGRGVGMDAIRNFLEAAGGRIEIKAEDLKRKYDVDQSPKYHAISFEIVLPKVFFEV